MKGKTPNVRGPKLEKPMPQVTVSLKGCPWEGGEQSPDVLSTRADIHDPQAKVT